MAKKPKKLNLKSIGQGLLVNQIRDAVVEFYHDGEIESVDIRIKQLPFAITDKLNARLGKEDETVVAEWISLTLVDEFDQVMFTSEQIESNFTQSLVQAIFNEVSGITKLKEFAEKLGKESKAKMSSGASLSSAELVEEQ